MSQRTPTSRKKTDEAPAIAAGLFKTALCRQHTETGKCKYLYRCMFAHGPRDLRTVEQNRSEGVVTSAAVAAFKARQYERKHGHAPPSHSQPCDPLPSSQPCDALPSSPPTPVGSASATETDASTFSMTSRRRYRRDPYGPPVVWL